MKRTAIAACLAAMSMTAAGAPTWQVISAEPGKRIEIDRTSIKREDGNKVTALGRVVLEKEIPDARSGGSYRIIEATTRYDCGSRSAATVKRVFRKSESEVLREEEQQSAELPVRSGTLDDKVLREVCRPAKADAREVAQKANEAAGKLKEANEALVKAEMAKSSKADLPKKTAAPAALAPEPAHGHEPAAAPARPAVKPVVAHLAPAVSHAAPAADHPAPAAPTARLAAVRGKPAAHAAAAIEHAHIHWSYDGEGGPDNWAHLDPANRLCATGDRQSPIDIRDGIRVDLEPIRFDYKPSPFRIVDNGHTVQVSLNAGGITITGKSYDLVQFHFHKPSEERVNGRGFDMVAHLVHRSYDGKLAVVAVLLEKGTEHPFIQTLWNNLPLEKQQEVSLAQTIDLNGLLPQDRNYYTYMGSLTTPPCSEGVLWLVMKQPAQVSPEQVAIFSRLYRNNARPIQPTRDRLIKDGR